MQLHQIVIKFALLFNIRNFEKQKYSFILQAKRQEMAWHLKFDFEMIYSYNHGVITPCYN